jgi:hypothetical protein
MFVAAVVSFTASVGSGVSVGGGVSGVVVVSFVGVVPVGTGSVTLVVVAVGSVVVVP